jgi:hypothetical protein
MMMTVRSLRWTLIYFTRKCKEWSKKKSLDGLVQVFDCIVKPCDQNM